MYNILSSIYPFPKVPDELDTLLWSAMDASLNTIDQTDLKMALHSSKIFSFNVDDITFILLLHHTEIFDE